MDTTHASAHPARQPDNLLGICHALGQAFGIDPLYLRLTVLAGMLADFQIAAIVYLLAGVVIAVPVLADRAAARLRHHRRVTPQRIAPSRLGIETKANATELSATP